MIAAGINDMLNLFILHQGRFDLCPDGSSMNSSLTGWLRLAKIEQAFFKHLIQVVEVIQC